MSETEKKEKSSKASQVKVSSGEIQYTIDKSLRRVCLEKANWKSKEKKEK